MIGFWPELGGPTLHKVRDGYANYCTACISISILATQNVECLNTTLIIGRHPRMLDKKSTERNGNLDKWPKNM